MNTKTSVAEEDEKEGEEMYDRIEIRVGRYNRP